MRLMFKRRVITWIVRDILPYITVHLKRAKHKRRSMIKS